MENVSIPKVDFAWYQRSFPGETVCGDKAAAFPGADVCWIVLADGLGHGRKAQEAAKKAVSIVEHVARTGNLVAKSTSSGAAFSSRVSLPELFVSIHESLKETIGAALGIAYVVVETGRVQFAGVGNILLRRVGSADTRMVCRDGIVGLPGKGPIVPKTVELVMAPGDLLLLTSDGIEEGFGLAEYSGLFSDSAASVARTVVERFAKNHDDATCLALRYGP